MGRFISNTTVAIQGVRTVLDVIGSCACTWVVPAGITKATFEIWGGGGAGVAQCCCYCTQGGGGGYSGGYALKSVTVTPGDSYTVCAGAGGAGAYCQSACFSCRGCTSYVTGAGLTNFCAEGGCGKSFTCCASGCICQGGITYGGDINIYGGTGGDASNFCGDTMCRFNFGAGSPFGGAQTGIWGNHCCPYITCGCKGSFPGGGGTGHIKCCCDCCGCAGSGGEGLVRITY